MNVSQNPDLLMDRRGSVDGRKFVSRSLLRSVSFLVSSATCLFCILYDISLAFRYWGEMHSNVTCVLFAVGMILLISWWGGFRYLLRLRSLYLEGLIEEVEQGSTMDIALGIAAGGITNLLLCLSGIGYLTVMFIGYHFASISYR
jgi:hypothetical protein